MKEGWEIKRLDEICEFGNGLWTGKKPPFQNVGVIRNTNFTKDGKLDDSDIVYLEVEQSQFAKRKLQYGDIILEKSGGGPKQPVGRVIIFDKIKGDFSFSNFTSSIRIANPKTVDFTYLHRFLFFSYVSGATETMQSHSTGIRNLKFDDYKAIKIPIPPLAEQQRIVAVLDEAFAAISKAKANAEQNLRNAKELFESYLQGVFDPSTSLGQGGKGEGWEEKTLGELFNIGSSKRIMEKDWTVDGVPFYGGKEIVKLAKFGFVVSNSYISEEKYNEYASKYDMPQNGDIMITARGTIGVGYIVKKDDKFYYKDGNIISMRAKMPTNPEFIIYALKSNVIYDQLRKLTGATVSHLPIEKAKLLLVMIPNFSTQNIVVEKIKEMEAETKKLEAIYQQKITDLDELKKSVLQKAFSGELKTQKVVDV